MRLAASVIRPRPIWVGLFTLLAAVWLATASTAAASGPPMVFDGKAHWDNWSWNTTVRTEKAWPIYDGKPSLSVRFHKDWAGLSFATHRFDTHGYKSLQFQMHSNGGPIPALQVGLHDKDDKIIKLVPATLYASLGDRGWYSVSIPLADLGAENKTITRVSLQQRHRSTVGPFNIAALHFSKHEGRHVKKDVHKDPATHTAYVFDDKPHWDNWSWNTKTAIQKHTTYRGGAALEVTYTKPWAGLSFATDGFVSGFRNLEFAMHPAGGPIPSLQAIVYDKSGEIGKVRVASYIKDVDKGWYIVSIPLADLGAESKEINRVTLQEGRGMAPRTFYVDELRFTWP